MAYEFENDGDPRALRLIAIAEEQFRAFNYEARSSFSNPEWCGWTQERLEQYFLDFKLPEEHAAKYAALRTLVEARDVTATLNFIAENGGTQVEGFWFIAYWQIILATVGSTPTSIALRKRIPWSAPEKIIVTLTARELHTAINAALDACNTCSNEQIKNLDKEKQYSYYERRREEYWSLQAKLKTFVSQSSPEARGT